MKRIHARFSYPILLKYGLNYPLYLATFLTMTLTAQDVGLTLVISLLAPSSPPGLYACQIVS